MPETGGDSPAESSGHVLNTDAAIVGVFKNAYLVRIYLTSRPLLFGFLIVGKMKLQLIYLIHYYFRHLYSYMKEFSQRLHLFFLPLGKYPAA